MSASDELPVEDIHVVTLIPGAKSRQNSYLPGSDSGSLDIVGPENIVPTVGLLVSDEAEGVREPVVRASAR